MNVLEFEAKALLREVGIALPKSLTTATAAEARGAFETIGKPVVVKAQVPIGGRMKAGGVRFADTQGETEAVAKALFDTSIRGFKVERVLIEEKVTIAQEVFIAFTYDQA